MKYDQPVEHYGKKVFFIQGVCVFYSAEKVEEAISKYRKPLQPQLLLTEKPDFLIK